MAVTCLKNGSPLIRPGTLVTGTGADGVISLENPNGDAVVDSGNPSGESVSFSRTFGEPIDKTVILMFYKREGDIELEQDFIYHNM